MCTNEHHNDTPMRGYPLLSSRVPTRIIRKIRTWENKQ